MSPTTSPETITQGDAFPVTTLATEPSVTGVLGGAPGLEAWIGYSSTDSDPSSSPGWTWVLATYSGSSGNTDEHTADIGPGLAPGTYYYASRHRLNGCGFTYGGNVMSGGFWNNNSQILIVNPAPLADVVITEIMYNSAGADDEWIEICNVSGSPQALNSYTIEVGGTTEFTFPNSGVIIANGDCITIALGEDTGNPIFNPDCPFTPDYTNGAGTGTLINTSDTISLIASDGSSIIDEVTYDDGDGADNTGESLHVVDVALDNSVTNTNYWEVLNGGSPGINSLISPCTPVGPEINLEGNIGNFPDIADNDITPSIFDGTDFGNLGVGSAIINEFRIENFAGTQNLDITSVTVLSGDTGDFSITALPATPIAPADPNGFSVFQIEFQPTIPGIRTALIEIRSNDADEDPYTFTVTGNGLCVANTITALPTSGPVGTVVTVTGTNLATATASFNGIAATVNNISATEMEVTVPAGATTGNLEIFDSLGCPGSTAFTVIDSEISSCEGSGGTVPTDLFISEITDATLGGLTYVELFNGTGAGINIDNYSIEVIANGAATAAAFNVLDLDNVVVPNGSTYVIAIGRATPVTSTNACTSELGGSGELASSANAQFTNGGINKRNNEHDVIRLVNSGTTVDEFGVYQDNDWMDSTIITGDRGFNFRRLNTATLLPDPTFTLAELGNWTVTDWVGSGSASCGGNDYSDIGLFDFSTGTPPVVNSISVSSTACNESTITVSANEGFSGGNALEYHWYFYNPAQSGLGWQTVINGGIYTTTTNSPDLIISDAASVADHQFYCEVREDDTSCYTASNAVSVAARTATWDGTNWNWNDGTAQNTVPTLLEYANVIINGDYDTSIGGFQTSFEACDCTVNAGPGPIFNTLTIENNTYVLVDNNLTVDGNIVVKTDGSFVQVNDTGVVDGDVLTDKTKIAVEKETALLATFREYTYWSSPVAGEVIGDGLLEADPDRIFSFSGENFRDSTEETNNNNATVLGQDDIDDNADDWQFETGATTMLPGVGYASTHNPAIFINPGQYIYIFEGPFNNGVFNVPIYRNDTELNDNNWNFIGNPYPSAIDADLFLAANASIDQSAGLGAITGAIFFWSHNTVADGNTNGNEELNYSQSDYAIINGSGQTAGGDGVTPTRHIPSGQGFFISMDNAAPSTLVGGTIRTTDIVFNNSMRITGNNTQFFRNGNNKLWIDLTSDNGVFNQILVAYVNGATDGDDGAYYDAYKNLSSELYSGIYSLINNSTDKKFAIQGKDPNTLTTDEIIHIGFNTVIDDPTIYTLSIDQYEGAFMNDNDIYLIDHLLNSIHNLKVSDYNFTSEKGEFNDRFEIVFRADALSIDDAIINSNELSIVELNNNGDVQFKVGSQFTITHVEILDVLGRQVYNLKGNSSIEVYNLSKLSKAPYVAKVTLSNGQVISKKAIKQ